MPVRPLESLTVTLPPAGTIPTDFQPTSVVVCEFLGYTDDNGVAILRQTELSTTVENWFWPTFRDGLPRAACRSGRSVNLREMIVLVF
ncbi:hypothetical protein [Rhodococcus sp. D-46]|uniref:hypothetical protein n=1 Tax=Rhodococcus sp. D-46 TaxID=2716265 RepID=UPI001A991A4A